jgi:hypothetical protein
MLEYVFLLRERERERVGDLYCLVIVSINEHSLQNKAFLKNLASFLNDHASPLFAVLLQGPAVENPYGDAVDPDKAPEAISKAVASLPPEQMFELMKQMKLCCQVIFLFFVTFSWKCSTIILVLLE